MALVADIKHTVTDTTPVYVAVGMTDLAAEKVREARNQAVTVRSTISSVSPRRLQKRALKQVEDAPAAVLNKTLELAGKAQEQYDALAARGEGLVRRIRNQQATQDVVAQLDQTASFGKGAVTTLRNAVSRTDSSARATVTTGRHQASRVADVISDVVVRDIRVLRDAGVESADRISGATADATKRTASAAKRTATTARKGAEASTSRAKAAATVARENPARALHATEVALDKVGTPTTSPADMGGGKGTVQVGPASATVEVGPADDKGQVRKPRSSRGKRTVQAGPVKVQTARTSGNTGTAETSSASKRTAKKSTPKKSTGQKSTAQKSTAKRTAKKSTAKASA